jgi:hypothetical protein
MNLLFDPKKLENFLIKKWIEFIDFKKVIKIASSTAEQQLGYSPPNIQNLKVTRFELVNFNYVIWIDYIVNDKQNLVNITLEIICDLEGEIKQMQIC